MMTMWVLNKKSEVCEMASWVKHFIFLRQPVVISGTVFSNATKLTKYLFIDTVLCLIKVNSNTIELIVRTSCYCVLDLLSVKIKNYFDLRFDLLIHNTLTYITNMANS